RSATLEGGCSDVRISHVRPARSAKRRGLGIAAVVRYRSRLGRVAGRASARRIADAGYRIRVGHAYLAFQSVGITEEHRQHRPEVGDEIVRCTQVAQALPNLIEILDRWRLQAEVVEAAAPEHRRLPLRFRVALDLEQVELRVRP